MRFNRAVASRHRAALGDCREGLVPRGDLRIPRRECDPDENDEHASALGALLGRIPLNEGSGGLGPSVRVGEIDQARGLFLGPEPLSRAFRDAVPDWSESDVRTLLAKFGLTGEHVPRPAASLSPGERTRAALALLQAREVNLLVLDEPTNHLDLPAIEQLEQALDAFPGTVLLVTHDRRMLEAVRVDRHWAVLDGRVTQA